MDFLWIILFLLWCEALSLPLRWLLAGWGAPPDVRRMLSRLAGPPLLALPVWLAAHAGGGFLGRGAGLAWVALALAAALLAGRRRSRSAARLMAYEGTGGREAALDAVLVALVLGFAAFRRWVPEMTAYQLDSSAAEKFANAMFYWSSWHARTLPPVDYWLAGNSLPYYYWGHFHWAWVARLGGFPATLAINLAFAVAVTMVWVGAYLLGRAVRLPRGWAAGAALCATWAGNPEALTQLRKLLPIWHQLGTFPWANYDFWAPSRAIPNVVDEFPAFSAILGDVHAHHLALPWMTGWLALTVAGRRWRAPESAANGIVWGLAWIALGAAAVLTNLWNLPLIGFALALALAAAAWGGGRAFRLQLVYTLILGLLLVGGMRLLRSGAPLPLPTEAATGFLARLPIRPVPPELRTPAPNLYGMWGLPVLVLAAGAVASLLGKTGRYRPQRPRPAGSGAGAGQGIKGGDHRGGTRRESRNPAPQAAQNEDSRPGGRGCFAPRLALVLAGTILILIQATPLGVKLPGGVAWAWAGVGLGVAAMTAGRRPWLSRRAALLLLGGCAVLAGLELVYMPDRFVGELARYNSYFKFSYPVWPVLWIGAWAVAWRLWWVGLPWPLRIGVRLGLVALLLPAAVYTTFAMPARILMARYGEDPPRRPTLDAFSFVAHRPSVAAEAPLLDWIRRHVPAGEVIAEGSWPIPPTESMAYKYQGRIASLTGHPIPIGWTHHEQQWRGPVGFEYLDRRIAEVNALYRASTAEELRQRAAELKVSWIVYGVREAELYGPATLAMLQASLRLAAAFPAERPSVFLFHFDFNPANMKSL